jgi:hypothetical protein
MHFIALHLGIYRIHSKFDLMKHLFQSQSKIISMLNIVKQVLHTLENYFYQIFVYRLSI